MSKDDAPANSSFLTEMAWSPDFYKGKQCCIIVRSIIHFIADFNFVLFFGIPFIWSIRVVDCGTMWPKGFAQVMENLEVMKFK